MQVLRRENQPSILRPILSMHVGLPCWLTAQCGLAPPASGRPVLHKYIYLEFVFHATGEVWLWQHKGAVEPYIGLCRVL
uniref:Uncharacterized protein n=1 Tax=Arundo donax TaxID=35708 RepID=A0A0A9DII8_ARUDO